MQKLLQAICSIARDVFVFQQDNAPAHRARDTVEFLRCETHQFISPDMWPANSPDLNPVDYGIWGMLQERVYRVPIHDTDELRKCLVVTWAEFKQGVVDDAVDQWRKFPVYRHQSQLHTRRPVSADRTARADNFRRDLEAT